MVTSSWKNKLLCIIISQI